MSIDYKSSRIEILTADSQSTLKNGVVTLVTGLVIGNDGGRRKFSQSFFLVSRNGSYFVLNDTFRYVSDEFVEPEATKEVEESQSTNAITGKSFYQWFQESENIHHLDIVLIHVVMVLISRACK